MVEALSRNLEDERVSGNLHGINLIIGVKGMNHSQFANDTILLGRASIVIVEQFKYVLDHFINASGGKVNNGKSQIYGWNISPKLLHAMSIILKFPYLESWATLNTLECQSLLVIPLLKFGKA
jgi:hypothetical protein